MVHGFFISFSPFRILEHPQNISYLTRLNLEFDFWKLFFLLRNDILMWKQELLSLRTHTTHTVTVWQREMNTSFISTACVCECVLMRSCAAGSCVTTVRVFVEHVRALAPIRVCFVWPGLRTCMCAELIWEHLYLWMFMCVMHLRQLPSCLLWVPASLVGLKETWQPKSRWRARNRC